MRHEPRPLEADGRRIKTRERYMDLFLEEEIMCDPDFARWFGARLGIADATALDAEASFRLLDGETDLVVMFVDGSGVRHLVHVENKVDTGFQKSQAERYRPRTRSHAALLGIRSSVTCLVAPARYGNRFIASSTMDHIVTYEELLAQFAKQEGPRAEYRARKIGAAIRHANYPVLCNLSDEELRMRTIRKQLVEARKRSKRTRPQAPQPTAMPELDFDTAA